MVLFLVTIIDGFDEICILIMIHKLDSKLISKTKKKKKVVIIVVIKFLSFIFGSHFAYSSIKIGFKLPKKKKNLQYFNKKNNKLAFRLFYYSIFSNKFLVLTK